jgi:hypothetical protein
MTFLAPGYLLAAGLVALGVVALHLLVTEQPKLDTLPTVRFIPDVPARSTTVAIRPSDLLLLLMRVAMILLIGAAFAQPKRTTRHQTVGRIVVVDVSRDVRAMTELADSARRYLAGATAAVLFDSTAREVATGSVGDSLTTLVRHPRPAAGGVLSSALIVALRAAARVRDGVDSLELVVVSPLLAVERDAATMTIRSLWPGQIRTVRIAAADSATLRGRAASPRTHVQWADSGATTPWTRRTRPDTVGAVRAGAAVLVHPFVRRWRAAAPDSGGRVSARWVDGEPAALDRMTANGCVRSLAITMPSAGDAMLRPDFVRFVDALSAPCDVARDLTPLDEEFLIAFRGPRRLAAAAAIKPPITRMTPLVPWLLAGALGLALVELLVRRRRRVDAEANDVELALERAPHTLTSARVA